MRNFVLQILRLPATADAYLQELHAKISWLFIWFCLYASTLGPYATGHHFGWINFIPLFLWVVAWTIIMFNPRTLAALEALRLAESEKGQRKEAAEGALSDTLPKVWGEICFWPLVVLFYLAMIDASSKPSLVWLIYAAALIYAVYTIRYQKDTRFFKKLSVTVAVIMIVVSLIRFIEPENQYNWFGSNVSALLKASPWDKKISVESANADGLLQSWEYLEWRKLNEKMLLEELTDKEMAKLNKLKEKRFSRSVPGRMLGLAKAMFNGIRDAWPERTVNAAPTPTKITAPAPQVSAPAIPIQPEPITIPTVYKVPERDYSGSYQICWRGGERCIWPKVNARGENLVIDYTYNNSAGKIVFSGAKIEDGKYHGQYVFSGSNGRSHSREFEMDLKNLSGWRLDPTGERDNLTIKKLS
jgi:hypothetical protein